MENAMNIKNFWKQNEDALSSSASVVDGNLILSLPDAINPVVWKMELSSAKSSALEVRKNPDGTSTLLLKTVKEDIHTIASFEQKDSAIKALMVVSQALKNADGKIYSHAKQTVSSLVDASPSHVRANLFSSQKENMKWLFAILGVVFVLFLFAYLSKSAPYPVEEQTSQGTQTSIGANPSDQSGVPQSADDVLKGF